MKRRAINSTYRHTAYRLGLAGAASLLVLLGLAASLWADNTLHRGITFRPTTLQAIPWAGVPQGGVNTFNLHLEPDPAVVKRTLGLARELGARYVRLQVPWEDIEIAGKGDFTDRRNDLDGDGRSDAVDAWAKYDRIVADAQSLGLELVMRIDRPPLWARTKAAATPEFQQGLAEDGNSTGPPDRYEDYGDFVGALASRYRGQVRFIQLWNEPNLKVEWNWQQPDPQAFVALLQAATSAAKRANPEVVILFPSLAPTDGLDASAPLSDLEFLDAVYRAGGAEAFDIMSAQLYGLGQPPSEHRYVYWRGTWRRPTDTRTDVSRIVLLREIMEQHGDTQKAIWIGEYGWNSAPERIPPETTNPDGSPITEEQQADFAARRATWGQPVSASQQGHFIVDLMQRARHEWPWVGAMDIWMLRFGGATAPDPVDPTPYFALVDRQFRPTAAFTVVQQYLQTPAVAGPGTHSWSHQAVETMTGGWRLRFAGNDLALVGGLPGAVQTSVDGQPTLLERNGTGDGRALWRVVPADTRLDQPFFWGAGEHTLEIVAPGAEPPEAFVVARQPPWPPWLAWALPTSLLLLLAACLLVVIGSLYQLLAREAV